MIKNVVPLKGVFMAAGIVGFLISAISIYDLSPTWGFTLMVFFVLMIVASLISMTYAPIPQRGRIR